MPKCADAWNEGLLKTWTHEGKSDTIVCIRTPRMP